MGTRRKPLFVKVSVLISYSDLTACLANHKFRNLQVCGLRSEGKPPK